MIILTFSLCIFQLLNKITIQNFSFNSMLKRIQKFTSKSKIHDKVNSENPTKKVKIDESSNLNLLPKKMCTMMTIDTKIEVLQTPVKSINDKKEYKVIRLENGLTACLISDPSNLQTAMNNVMNTVDSDSDGEESESENESDSESAQSQELHEETETDSHKSKLLDSEEKMAAASLTIGVGSFSDPESIPGLAHFLEHMVFMGSAKYPKENDFDAFLKKRGGSDNASTDCENTTFYFECQEKYLLKALDKFAQFFICPLMKREAMTREREAIDSEFQMALPSDSYRREQLLANFAEKKSPVNKFVWGNLITLRDNVTDDILYTNVHAFMQRHYSAHRMTLAIQARLPIEILESYVISCFYPVPNNKLPGDDFKKYNENIFNTSDFKRMYYIKPVKNQCQLDLTWTLPPLLNLYESKPHRYVSWLLGHEGEGSLCSYLKKKLWALAIDSGNSENGLEYNSIYSLFSITLVLTPEGLNHICEIIEAIFSYICLLKEVGPQERIFNEIKHIADTSFRFKEEEDAVDFVEDLSEKMQFFPPEHYLTGDALFYKYDPEGISLIVNKLNPDNVNIMISSSNFSTDIVFNKTEKWFSTSYTDKDIPEQWINKWKNVRPMKCFALPGDNTFITKNFDVLDLSNSNVPLYPEKIVDTDLVDLWYKPDIKFKLPQAFIYYYLTSDMPIASVENVCMLDLFISILAFQLTEEAYPAHVTDLNYSLNVGSHGINIKLDGYNEKLPLLLDLIIKYIKNLPEATNEKLFIAVKDKETKNYYNSFIKPSKLARCVRLDILSNVYYSTVKKHQAILNITFAQFKNFSINFLQKMHLYGLIQGNISKEEAHRINNSVIVKLNCSPLPIENIPRVRANEIPEMKHCCRVLSFNEDDTNSIITNYYQIGPGTMEKFVITEMIMLMMEEPVFDILRTKEQLGYHVYNTLYNTYGILGYSITVNAQEKKTTTEYVDSRIESFVKFITKSIKRSTEKQLNDIKRDLIKIKQLVDVHLKDEVTKNWNEIIHHTFMFDRLTREIEAIHRLKSSDIKKFLENINSENTCRKLSIQIVGHNKNKNEEDNVEKRNVSTSEECYEIKFVNENENNENYIFINDIDKFKSKLNVFPVHKIV